MATSGIYYLDAGNLEAATSVYSDATLTTKAADQWYSNGQIARQQVAGTLGTAQICACNIVQNYLLRDLDIRNTFGTSLTVNQARFKVGNIGGVSGIITAGATTITNNSTVRLLDEDLRLTSNLLVQGDYVYIELDISGNPVGVGFDFDLHNNTIPIAGALLNANITSSYNSGTNETTFVIPFELTSAPPNNFTGYVKGRLTITSL